MSERAPRIRDLDRDACLKLLKRNSVGRIAFSHHDEVDIEPLHYVLEGEWMYLRTSEGSKVALIAHNQWVAFEIDEVEDLFRWRSVVVHGSIHRVTADASGVETHEHAIEAMRRIIPEALTESDPVPFRDVLLRIHVDKVTGREAKPDE